MSIRRKTNCYDALLTKPAASFALLNRNADAFHPEALLKPSNSLKVLEIV
jgi:hypothetical protein